MDFHITMVYGWGQSRTVEKLSHFTLQLLIVSHQQLQLLLGEKMRVMSFTPDCATHSKTETVKGQCSRNTHLCLLELTVTHLQLDAALAFIMMQPVHKLDLLQILVMKLFPFWHKSLVPSRILLEVSHKLVPLCQETLSLLTFHFQLKPRKTVNNCLNSVFM